jgi:DNA-binding NarL/FixJ family response regulator
MKLQIGIVDDNDRISQQIAEKLLLTDEVEILFIADRGKEALEWLGKHRTHPQVILMDIEMPGMNGIETTFKVKDLYPDLKIIMLTVFDNEVNIFNAIKSGASGYLLKDETLPRMMEAFNDVMEGGVPMSPSIARKAMEMMVSGYKPDKQQIMYTDSQEELSKREMEILGMMAEGQKVQKIAEGLFISPFTVKKHIENIYTKLHVKSRVELLLWYQQA